MTNIKTVLPEMNVLKESNPATMARLMNSAVMEKRSRGEYLYMDREEVNSIYFLVEGKLSIYKTSSGGEKKIIFLLSDGAAVNEDVLYEKFSSAFCEVMEDSIIVKFSVDQFIAIMNEDFQLSKALINSLSMKVKKLYRQLKNTPATVKGEKKIVSKIWKITLDNERDGNVIINRDGEIIIPMTITCLAEMIGSKRETVSRQVKSLTEKGLIRHENGSFYIPDRENLIDYYYKP